MNSRSKGLAAAGGLTAAIGGMGWLAATTHTLPVYPPDQLSLTLYIKDQFHHCMTGPDKTIIKFDVPPAFRPAFGWGPTHRDTNLVDVPDVAGAYGCQGRFDMDDYGNDGYADNYDGDADVDLLDYAKLNVWASSLDD